MKQREYICIPKSILNVIKVDYSPEEAKELWTYIADYTETRDEQLINDCPRIIRGEFRQFKDTDDFYYEKYLKAIEQRKNASEKSKEKRERNKIINIADAVPFDEPVFQ